MNWPYCARPHHNHHRTGRAHWTTPFQHPHRASRHSLPSQAGHSAHCIQGANAKLHYHGPTVPRYTEAAHGHLHVRLLLAMLSPNDGYNEIGLTMQSAGPVREEWQPIHLSYLYQGSEFGHWKVTGGTMPLPSDIPASPRQMYANCWTAKHTTTKSVLLGQDDSSQWSGYPVPKMQLQAHSLSCFG